MLASKIFDGEVSVQIQFSGSVVLGPHRKTGASTSIVDRDSFFEKGVLYFV